MEALILKAITEGGPYAVGVIGWAAWLYERRTNREMTTQLIQLASAQIEATVRHEGAIDANTRIMERLLTR